MPLSDRQIKNAKPVDKVCKLVDGGGLYLQVTPVGGKLWRLKYRISDKEKLLSIGKYPEISLMEAREAIENARRMMIAQGTDPEAMKQQAKQEHKVALLNNFENLAWQWHAENLHSWKQNHADRIMRELEKDVFPYIGKMPIDEIKIPDVKVVIEKIYQRNAKETAEEVRQWVGEMYHCIAKLELTTPLGDHFEQNKVKHIPALLPERITEFCSRHRK